MKKIFKIATLASVIALGQILPARRLTAPLAISRAQLVPGAGQPDLAKLTVKQLRKLATQMKIKGRSKAVRKADLVKLITKASAK